MADLVIGKKEQIIKDPNVLAWDEPYYMFKSKDGCYFVQRGMIFALSGLKVADSETSKKEIWNIQQTPIGRSAAEHAGLAVSLNEVDVTPDENDVIVQYPDCEKSFKTQQALNRHKVVHKAPTSLRR